MLLEALLLGHDSATPAEVVRRAVVARPARFDLERVRQRIAHLSHGGQLVYVVQLETALPLRLLTLVTMGLRSWSVRRAIARGGAQIVGAYGIDPGLESPAFVYELDTAASAYADRYLRTRGSSGFLRRILARSFGCDPALGAVAWVLRKP